MVEIAMNFDLIGFQHNIIRQIHFKMNPMFVSYLQSLTFFRFVKFNQRFGRITGVIIITRGKHESNCCQKANHWEIKFIFHFSNFLNGTLINIWKLRPGSGISTFL